MTFLFGTSFFLCNVCFKATCACRMLQSYNCVFFNLADALFCERAFFTNFFKRHWLCTVKAVAHADNAGFVWTECINYVVDIIMHRLFDSLFFWTIECVIFEEVANFRTAVIRIICFCIEADHFAADVNHVANMACVHIEHSTNLFVFLLFSFLSSNNLAGMFNLNKFVCAVEWQTDC